MRYGNVDVIQTQAKKGQTCSNCKKEFREGERIRFAVSGIQAWAWICYNGFSCENRKERTKEVS